MHLYDSKTSRALDKKIVQKDIPNEQLIMKAANEIWEISKNFTKSKKIWCLSGSGNNGADAIGVAGLGLISKKDVTLILTKAPKGSAKNIFEFMKLVGLKYTTKLPSLKSISETDLIIDGLIGTGLSRPLDSWLEKSIDWINNAKEAGATVISIDIPSGLNASDGTVFKKVVNADATVMCLSPKQGCYTGFGPSCTGTLYNANLGYQNTEKLLSGTSYLLTKDTLTARKRRNTSHKGNYGNVLILGGWDGMEGAGLLAATASLKVGAGKVYLCGPESKHRPPEVIGVKRNIDDFNSILRNIDCIVAGPGLGKNADDFLFASWSSDKPLILDADGLNWLSKNNLPRRKSLLIGTPHPGEARALLNCNQKNRFEAIRKLKRLYGGDWILKGAGTLITNSNNIYVNPFSNSILATAGSGDVLAGIIGGLVSQKHNNAALTAVWLQSEAARIFLQQGETTILASELLHNFSEAFMKIETRPFNY